MATNVLVNADVRAVDRAGTRASAIAWRDGIVTAIGSRDDVLRVAGDDAIRFDAGGATVLPGFVDAHHHPCIVALYGAQLRLAPPAVTDIVSLQRALAAAAASLPDDRWLVATDWDEARLAERRAPTREELDDAVPDRPVVALHYSCHRAVANGRALERAGIGRSSPDPSGGHISRGRHGLPDGLLVERAISRVESLARTSLLATDAEGFLERLSRHHCAMAEAGITLVADATVPPDLATLYREAVRRRLLVVPTVMMPVSVSGWLDAPWSALDGPKTGQEDGPLVVGPLKLAVDGAPACAMCLGWLQVAGVTLRGFAMSVRRGSLDPVRTSLSLRPRFGREIRTGITLYRPDEIARIVRAAVDRGFAVATHAIGNEAVALALSAYEKAGSALSRVGAPRIEHAIFVDRELVARLSGVGATVVAQPHMISLPAFASAPSIPRVRNTPLRWLLDAGVKVAGSSDFPVAGLEPLDGIRDAVARRTTRGDVFEPDQRVDLDEAIAMYTRTAAEACGRADRCGTLEVGKRADLVVIDRRLEPTSLPDARVRATVISGEIVFGSPGAPERVEVGSDAAQAPTERLP
ncbi:MAG: amidohydrolase [Deltaproteobacteria bacterium]|nr:amidohydrolase [Deltaproteobacteria bacterium]